MGKYTSVWQSYKRTPSSMLNFYDAIVEIGRIDPQGIKRTRLNGPKPKPNAILSEKQLFNRGILNVRSKLNGRSGKTGKYSISMIRHSVKIVAHINQDDNTVNACWINGKFPIKDIVKIVNATYSLLKRTNFAFLLGLTQKEKDDTYFMMDIVHSKSLKTIAPIQINMIARSIGADPILSSQFESFRNQIKGVT